MSCEWGAKLDRYVDGELRGHELLEMEKHVGECAECAPQALSRLQLKRAVKAEGMRYGARPEFRAKIERTMAAGAARGSRLGTLQRWAMAAVLLIALVGLAVWQQSVRSEEAFGEFADLHIATLASTNPVDVVSSDRHTVKPWFQGKLPFSFNLPELENSPFTLIGGRLIYFGQSPGAQLLCAVGKHRISVFILQERGAVSGLGGIFPFGKKLPFASETWAAGGLRYVVVSDASAGDVRQLSELLKKAASS